MQFRSLRGVALWVLLAVAMSLGATNAFKGVRVYVQVKDKFSKRALQYPKFGIYRATDSVGVPIQWWTYDGVNTQVTMPDGVPGDYYIEVMTSTLSDAGTNEEMAHKVSRQGEFESVRVPFTVKPFKDSGYEVALGEVSSPEKS